MTATQVRIVRSLTEEQREAILLQRQREIIATLNEPIQRILQSINEDPRFCIGCAITIDRSPQIAETCIARWALTTALPAFTRFLSFELLSNRKGTPVRVVASSDIISFSTEIEIDQIGERFFSNLLREIREEACRYFQQ